MKKSEKRVPVMVDRMTYVAFKAYAQLTGNTVAEVIREALEDFRETSLEVRLEAFQVSPQETQCNIIPIDVDDIRDWPRFNA